MKNNALFRFFNHKLVTSGILFFAVNAWVRYDFYHANSYKILTVLIAITILFLQFDVVLFKSVPSVGDWKYYVVLFIPLLATFPGYFYHQGNFNYNFNYELTINLVLILWAIYLIRSIQNDHDLTLFLIFMGLTIFYVSTYAFGRNSIREVGSRQHLEMSIILLVFWKR